MSPFIPSLEELQQCAHIVSLPMRVRFRGITTRTALLFDAPCGFSEWSAFPEYGEQESSVWLDSAVEMGWNAPEVPAGTRVHVNATVPDVSAGDVPQILERFPGCRTIKMKVAAHGSDSLRSDCERLAAIGAWCDEQGFSGRVRVDANGGWSVTEAVGALRALNEVYPLDYAEQPCATVEELVQVRRLLSADSSPILVAADESIRRQDDPLQVVRQGGADIAVVKVAPLGGPSGVLNVASQLDIPLVVSSALDTSVGIYAGLYTAARLGYHENYACGLATGSFFQHDIAPPRSIHQGTLVVEPAEVDREQLRVLRADRDTEHWWRERLQRAYSVWRVRQQSDDG